MGPVLKPDTGGRYFDQNADRTPGSPLQALIHAVQTCQPGFDFTDISIVTDRKPLRSFLGFVRAEPVAFKFGVTVIGDTALFTRMEKRTRDHPSKYFRGYRDAFEEQYTKVSASAARSTSHHRVVKYAFAGETILLRHAVDAFLGDVAEALMQAEGIESTDMGPWVKQQKNVDFKGNPPSKTLPDNTPVTVIDGGRHIPHTSILELTTRSEESRGPDIIERKMPDFWISQTLNYHLCMHREKWDESSRSTIFNRIRLVPMGDLLLGWEADNAEKLRALAHALRQVIEAAKELGESCVVSFDGREGASLNVSRAEVEEVPVLPEDMQSLFLPIKNDGVDSSVKMEEGTMSASTADRESTRTRKRKRNTEDAPASAGSPSAKKVALSSIIHSREKAAVLTQDGELATTAGMAPIDGTRKRKLDTEDAPEQTDPHPARRRALNPTFRT